MRRGFFQHCVSPILFHPYQPASAIWIAYRRLSAKELTPLLFLINEEQGAGLAPPILYDNFLQKAAGETFLLFHTMDVPGL